MENRLTELETKISFQDQLLEELNKVVIELRWKLEKLEKQTEKITEAINDSDLKDQKDEVPPPHY